MAGLKGRMRRAQQEAKSEGVVLELADGTRKVFSDQDVWAEMFLTRMDLFKGESRPSEVLSAVRAATPESRAAFEAKYGALRMEACVVAPDYQGGWAEVFTLLEDGTVETTFHEGGTPEVEAIREEARRSPPGF